MAGSTGTRRTITEDEDGGLYVQREFHNEADRQITDLALADRRLWTMVDGDDGELVLVQGAAHVNRQFYVVCAKLLMS